MPSGDVFLLSGSAAMFVLVVNDVPGQPSLNGRLASLFLTEFLLTITDNCVRGGHLGDCETAEQCSRACGLCIKRGGDA